MKLLIYHRFLVSFMHNPIVEKEDLFLRSVGEDSDIVTKVYVFSYYKKIGDVYIS